MSITSMQKKLLLSLSTLLISGATVVSFSGHASAIRVKFDVNAGPIYNNDQAKQVCPGVCQNLHTGATWSGQWRTTVPGKNSVCGCFQDRGR